MLNLASIPSSLIKKDTVTFALTSNLVQRDSLDQLCNAYPNAGYQKCLRDSGPKKHYSFDLLDLVLDNEINAEAAKHVHPIWISFAKALLSKEYHDCISNHLNVDLDNARINLGLYKFGAGDWVSPHLDNEDKILTQIFYFNDYWSKDWGGYFKLLNSNNNLDEYFSMPPFVDFSVILLRNEFAWHMVTPVTKEAQNPRLSMQLEFIKRDY